MSACNYGMELYGLDKVVADIKAAVKLSDTFAKHGDECFKTAEGQVREYATAPNFKLFKCLDHELWEKIGKHTFIGAEKHYRYHNNSVGKLSRSSLNDLLGTFVTDNCACKLSRSDKADVVERMRARIKLDNGHDETTHQLFAPIIIRTRHGKTKLNTGACQPVNTHVVDPEKNKGLIWTPNGMNSLDVEKEDHITPFLEDFIHASECALYGNMPNAFGVAPIDSIINNQSRFYISVLSGNLGLLQIRHVFLYGVTRIGKGWIPRWINRQVLGLERECYINHQLIYGGSLMPKTQSHLRGFSKTPRNSSKELLHR